MEHGNVLFRVLCILTVLYFDVIAPDYDVLTHLILRTLLISAMCADGLIEQMRNTERSEEMYERMRECRIKRCHGEPTTSHTQAALRI